MTQTSELLHQTIERLRASEEQFRRAFEAAAIGMALIGPSGNLLRVNQALCEILGYSESELLAIDFQKLTHPDDLAMDLVDSHRLLEGQVASINRKNRYIHKDGHIVYVLLGVSLVRDASLTPVYFVAHFQDVTGRYRAQEERNRLVIHAPCPMAVLGYDGLIRQINPAILDSGGWSSERELINRPFLEFFHPDDVAIVAAEWEKLLAGGSTQSFEVRSRNQNGEYRWYSWSATSVPEWNNIYAIGQDVTDRKHAEDGLRLNEAAMSAAANGIAITDLNGMLEWVNPAFARLTGYAESEAIGKNPKILKSGKQPPGFYENLWKTITAGRVWHGELTNRRKDGSHYVEEMTITPVRDSAGSVSHFVAIKQDITDRRLAEQQLRDSQAALEASKQTAEAANQAKSQFLANMSHEIRTPMNAIIGLTRLALDTQLSFEQREFLNGVMLSAESLLKIINLILDFSKIEAGKLELERIDFQLREVLESTLKVLGVRAQEQHLELILEIGPNVPEALIGDPTRLRQIVINLVGNALKFTEAGEIAVLVVVEEIDDSTVTLQLTISDTGIGIPAEQQQKLFQPFNQADNSTTRKFGGTGLGLAITARLVEALKGRIWFESVEGRGSQFHFTATFDRQSGVATRDVVHPPNDVMGRRVLVVDDNATTRRVQAELLADWGMKPTVVANGRSAIQTLQESAASEEPFDVVLLDSVMPEMDGLAVLAQMRRIPEIDRPAILVLSLVEVRGAVTQAHQLGAAAYLQKPIGPIQLREAIVAALGLSDRSKVASPVVPTSAPTRSLKILVAEDNKVNQLLAQRTLEKCGHRVVVANNGEEAVSVLAREPFDLILMDIQMPVLDGFQATSRIRQQECISGHHMPIVAMTAHALKGDREKCLAAGMDGYVSKPIQMGELFDAISAALGAGDASTDAMLPSPITSEASKRVQSLIGGQFGEEKGYPHWWR